MSQKVSEDGSITLRWEKIDGCEVILEQSAASDFSTRHIRYRGADSASVITGLPEGVHYFRIADAATQDWSKPLAIQVEFFPQWKLWLILTIGAVVVLATIGTIATGYLISKKREVEND